MKSKQEFFSTVFNPRERINLSLRILFFTYVFFSISKTVTAQIVPDNTINTQVEQSGNTTEITGGETRGGNLFHSFQDFSIQTGNEALFNNADSISNVFSRVTGGNISNIDGLIRANGNANLFFINPSGVIFGENTRLDIGGSFLTTTAETVDFPEGRFSAVEPEESILSIDFPVGLGFGSDPGNIEVQGQQNNVSIEIPSFKINTEDLPQGIEVNRGKSISLIGGNINFRGGGLQAPGGNIQLASINDGENINFLASENWFNIDLSNISQFDDIIFKNAAYVDVSDNMAGNIFLSGAKIILDDGSVVLANTNESSNNSININASEEIKIQGTSGEFNNDKSFIEIENITSGRVPREPINNKYSISLIGADIFSETNTQGNNININSPNLEIFDAGQIRALSFPGRATPGEITINADSILAEGTNNIDSLISSTITGGNINISSQSLEVKNGARINTDAFNSEASGLLTIDSENITLQGYPTPYVPRFTGLFAIPSRNPDRESINIKTKTLHVLDGARINANSVVNKPSGNIDINAELIEVSGFIPFANFVPSAITSSVDINNAGRNIDSIVQNNPNLSQASAVNINTEKLSVLNGARIEAINNIGDSGTININAEIIELNGTRPRVFNFIGGISTSTRASSLGNGGDINIKTDSLKVLNGSIIRAISLSDGDAGDININADEIEISGVDRFADIPVSSQRVSQINTGATNANGGTININSNSLELDNQVRIGASTNSDGLGGEIFIDSDFVFLQNLSLINANTEGGTGGNINIDSDFILGLENSDITANAVSGSGGNIAISSNNIFGLVSRAETTNQNDITASSEIGIDGTIQIDTPDINLQKELEQSDLEFVAVDQAIANSCLARGTGQTSFSINDNEKLPNNPNSNYSDANFSLTGVSSLPTNYKQPSSAQVDNSQHKQFSVNPAEKLVETEDGRILLVAAPRKAKSLYCQSIDEK